MVKKILKSSYLLILILIFAGFLRLVDLGNNPRSLYGDELTAAYDSYSILKTGYDQKGNFLPITFELGGNRPAGYIYGSIPFIWIFGPSALGIRMLSVLSGLGIVILMFLLGKKLFEERVGLLAATLTAISPWAINLSRGGFETHFALFLTLVGVYCLLISKTKPWLILATSLTFALAVNTYSTYKMTIPLMIILLVWFVKDRQSYFKASFGKYTFAAIAVIVLTGVLLINQVLFANSQERFNSINVFGQKDLAGEIVRGVNIERSISSLPNSLKPFFYNKSNEYFGLITSSYLNNFSWNFLFLKGDENPRHNMAVMGQFYIVEILLMVLGLMVLVRQKRKAGLIIGWILIAATPATLMLVPHALRSSLMIPPLILLSALGTSYLIGIAKPLKNIALIIIIVAIAVQFIFFVNKYYFLAPEQFRQFWSYSAKLASQTAMENSPNYDYVIITERVDSIEFAYPVYAKVDPRLVIEQNKNGLTDLGRYQFRKYGNIYIGPVPDSDAERFLSGLGKSVLYIGPDGDQRYLNNFETIKGVDGKTDLVIKKI